KKKSIVGPGGGTARKPVGLVYIAVADRDGATAVEHHFEGDRAQVTSAATREALVMLLTHIERDLRPR
ncbi:MAG: CinA family protein, partial [Thermomicrobiales bacterium]|nr:CinA family protein [Thermomicrobiales bacterium]